MIIARTATEVLAEHVTLEVEGIDRMFLNVYQPKLQHVNGVVGFLRGHRGHPFASSALMDPISKEFVAAIHRFCRDHDVEMVEFAKGQRKDDLAVEHLARFEDTEGVLFVGRAQEKTRVFRTEKRRNPDTGASYPWIVSATGWSTTSTSTASMTTSAWWVYRRRVPGGPCGIGCWRMRGAPSGTDGGVGLEPLWLVECHRAWTGNGIRRTREQRRGASCTHDTPTPVTPNPPIHQKILATVIVTIMTSRVWAL